jgi:hypothetical protein
MPKKIKDVDKFIPYPPALRIESGCKVGWHIYATEAEAEACADAARINAQRMASLGYDFGYLSPGDYTRDRDGNFRVVVP